MTEARSTHRIFMATATAMALFTLMSMALAVHFAPNATAVTPSPVSLVIKGQ